MHAMLLSQPHTPLEYREVPLPEPYKKEVRIRIHACGVCRTDLHLVDGELPNCKLPIIPGHQIAGVIDKLGEEVTSLKEGMRVGVPWLGYVCGTCEYCLKGKENLCEKAQYTGCQIDGGYAEYCVAHESFTLPLPKEFGDWEAAPLLCAGLIGYRSYRMVPPRAKKIGFYGFGAAAHILIQLANYEKKEVFAFTRKGDTATQTFAKSLGASWAGDSEQLPPEPLDAAIIFAPVGTLVPQALKSVKKGGSVICAGIHMSEIPAFPYSLLWEERVLRSVANLTRQDGIEFLKLAPKIPIQTSITTYPLKQANQALDDLRSGNLQGAAVLLIR